MRRANRQRKAERRYDITSYKKMKGDDCIMDQNKLDALVEQAASFKELADELLRATKELKGPLVSGDGFTKKELDAVMVEVDKLKQALTALVPVEDEPVEEPPAEEPPVEEPPLV